ncbi:TetR/AcrR family transcriptional regulator [Hyphomonas sp.]|uniref:TetR/AcrR family transcriptional regulator n=1 Tax=Hyphomonas sp. TaxID=87 RepID=UPI0025C21D09|nr:TetR/AcrR family transcriptional regulator [Hyphomonas sp.]MBI1400519.1 TetR family transcriptional regulator [Hyphomonas sp.]
MSKPPVHELEPSPPATKSRGDLRREAFLTAAREVFLEQGYDAASMAEIVRRAGGSLTTLYNQFGDKQGLFLAMIRERAQLLSASMFVELSAHTPIETGLTRIAEQSLTMLLEPQSLEMYRLLLSLGAKHPEVAAAFQANGPDRVSEALAAYLMDRAEAGEIAVEDPVEAAFLFIALARAGLVTRALLNPSFRPGPDEIKASVRTVVQLFLHGVQVR